MLMISSICFSLSHWVFSFKYWACAQRLSLLLKGHKPNEMDGRINIINYIVITLNIIFPAFYAWTYTINITEDIDNTKNIKGIFYFATSLNLILQLLSLVFLSVALWQIKYQIKTRSVLTVKSSSMCLHYGCFVFFLVTLVIFYVGDLIDPPPQDLNVHLTTEILKIFSSVLLQLSLGVVMWSLINQSDIQARVNRMTERSCSSNSTVTNYLYKPRSSTKDRDVLKSFTNSS